MNKFSKIVAGVLLATMTMLCAFANAEETQVKDPNVYGILLFAQPIEKETKLSVNMGYKAPVYFDDLNSMVLALRAKKIDAIIDFPQPVAEYICNRNQDMQTAECYDERWHGNLFLRMGVAKNDIKTCEFLNSAIKELKENGKLEALQKKYVDAYLQKGKEPKPVTMPKFENAQVIKIAVTGDNPPIDLVAADGTPAGFNVAMLAEIAKLKKVNIIPIPMNSGARFLSLNKKIVDVIFYTDVAEYNEASYTELWEGIHVPDITTTDIYAKYPIRYIYRK